MPIESKKPNQSIKQLDPLALAFEPEVSPWRKALSGQIVQSFLVFCRFAGRYWLWLLNGISLFFFMVAFAVPLVQGAGGDWLARPVFDFCHLVCVQDPNHSFYIGGHQMAVCERCLAIYAAMGLVGLVFQLTRYRWRPLKFWQYGLFALPMALDGFSQLFGWRESVWELRLLTGGLFGFGTVWYMYPQIEAWMNRLKSWAGRELART